MSYKNQILFVWKNISSPQSLVQHFIFLPYHLIVTTIKSRGLFLLGFFGAVNQLLEALSSRRRMHKLWKLTDEAILQPKK